MIDLRDMQICTKIKSIIFAVGIDIPDYISTGGKTDALRDMSNKMKAMG